MDGIHDVWVGYLYGVCGRNLGGTPGQHKTFAANDSGSYMSAPTRRSLLRVSGSLFVGTALAGCSGMASITDGGTTRETTTGNPARTTTGTDSTPNRTATSTDEPTEKGTNTVGDPKDTLKIWTVAANPKGRDSKHLNDETVTVEAQGVDPIDATGYTLEYDTGRKYTFPELVSDLPRGTTISIHSGPGENSVDTSVPPQYALFVGSKTPLLDNGGGTLVLENPDGATVEKVSYPALNEGIPYALPTPPSTVTPHDSTTRSTAKPIETTSSKVDSSLSGPDPIGDLNPSRYDSFAKVQKAVSFDLPTIELPEGYTFARAAVTRNADTAGTNQEYVALIYASRSENSAKNWTVVYIVRPRSEANFRIGRNISIGDRTGAYYRGSDRRHLLFACNDSEYEVSGPFTQNRLVQIARSVCPTNRNELTGKQ